MPMLCVCAVHVHTMIYCNVPVIKHSSTTSYLMPVRSSGTGWLVVVFFVGCGRRGRGAWRLFGCRWRRLGGTQGCLQSHQLPLGSLWGGVRNGSVGGNYTVGWIVYTVNFRLLVPSKHNGQFICLSVHGTSNLKLTVLHLLYFGKHLSQVSKEIQDTSATIQLPSLVDGCTK